jgi:hypothetical protein
MEPAVEHADEELEAASWTEHSGGDGHLCSAHSKPTAALVRQR